FTGSKAVGMHIHQGLSRQWIKPCLLEMGGKNAAIVMDSADLDAAADGITRSAFGLQNQKCSATSRVYVHQRVARALVEKLIEKTKALKLGDPTERDVFFGPVINAAAVERFARAVAQARQEGTVLEGGERLQDGRLGRGHFVAPTIVRLPLSSSLFVEELFVPILAVGEVAGLEQAIAEANKAEYGLTAGIFSKRPEEIERFFDEIEAGVCYVNKRTGATTGGWPGARPSTSYPKEYPLAIARGERAMVEDVDGNRYLDFMAGIAVASTGYGHPKVVQAIQEAAGRFLHICGSDFYFESFAALCERLAQLAPGKSKKRVFLSNSGTEAVEGAIKLARHSTGRPAIVAFTGAFHGRTYGGLSLTASKSIQRAGFAPFLPEVYHVPYGYRYRCDFCRGEPACTMRCVSSIEDGLFATRLDPQSVAAVFVEPIQGEGGYVVPPPGYLKALRELCDRYGILLVCDEVQCGVGRTGKMWACEHEG